MKCGKLINNTADRSSRTWPKNS